MAGVFNQTKNNIYVILTKHLNNYVKEFRFNSVDAENHLMVFNLPNIYNLSRDFITKNISIGLILMTKDKHIIIVEKHHTYAYQHIISNKIIFYSKENLLYKISILSDILYKKEIDKLNNKLKETNININSTELTFLQIMKIYNLSFKKRNNSLVNNLQFPGGKRSNKDKNMLDTCKREVLEEISPLIVPHIKFQTKYVTYYNIFDMIVEKYYHNILFYGETDLTKAEIETMFQPSYEVENLKFIHFQDLPFAFQSYINFIKHQ